MAMVDLKKSEVTSFIVKHAQEFMEAQRALHWSSYGWWPGWSAIHSELDPGVRVQVWQESILVTKQGDHVWAVPYSSKVDEVREAVANALNFYGELEIALPFAMWAGFKPREIYTEYSAKTSDVVDLSLPSLKKRRSAIRKFQNRLSVVLWQDVRKEDALNLVGRWADAKAARGASTVNDAVYELLVSKDILTYWPSCRGIGVYDGQYGSLVGLGLGSELHGGSIYPNLAPSLGAWTSLLRITDTTRKDLSGLSDFVYSYLAKEWLTTGHLIARDGPAYSGEGNGDVDRQLRFFKQQYSSIEHSTYTCTITEGP